MWLYNIHFIRYILIIKLYEWVESQDSMSVKNDLWARDLRQFGLDSLFESQCYSVPVTTVKCSRLQSSWVRKTKYCLCSLSFLICCRGLCWPDDSTEVLPVARDRCYTGWRLQPANISLEYINISASCQLVTSITSKLQHLMMAFRLWRRRPVSVTITAVTSASFLFKIWVI